MIPRTPDPHLTLVVNRPRRLAHHAHHVMPPAVQPLARAAWQIEQHLDNAWDAQEPPCVVLDWFAPERAAAALPLLDAVLDAADECAVVEARMSPLGWSPVFDDYDDAMYRLVECLRGAA